MSAPSLTAPASAPPAFHVMAKPTGAACNLDCSYCFFLSKASLYPDRQPRMSDAVMERYICQTIQAHRVPDVTIAWQGGEPTLMGLDFFRRAVAVQHREQKPGTTIHNTFQTNGVLLDDEWCAFLKEHNFLVGISIDGPRELHDVHRRDRGGGPTFNRVERGLHLLQQHGVDYNILCTVNSANADHPLEVYRFFRDELGAQFIQLIPVVERAEPSPVPVEAPVSERSVRPEQYGRFLVTIFDEWVHRDVGRMFVQVFDGVLAAYVRGYSTLCIFQPTCGRGVALLHNGEVFSCDHFVDPAHRLGNILELPLGELVGSDQQRCFGQAKRDTLPRVCHECPYLFACHGECPKNRLLLAPDGEPGLNYLCAGLQSFFAHTEQLMQTMAWLLRRGLPASGVMAALAREEQKQRQALARAGRNDPCPCGSGMKVKKCHGAGSRQPANERRSEP